MVRAATTGITAFIDARGRVTRQSGRFTEEVLVDEVRPLRVTGLYVAMGPWFAWLCTAVCLGLLFRSRSVAAANISEASR